MSQHHELHAVSAQSLSSYCAQLQNSGVSPLEMSRRLENIGRFLKWAYQKDYVLYQDYQHMKDLIAKSTSHIQQSASISATSPLSDAPKLKKTLMSHSYGPTSVWPRSTTSPEPEVPHTRFKKGIIRPASRFNPPALIGLLMTMLVFSILGASIYEKFIGKAQSTFAYPSSPTFTSTRVLSFQGRLTDSLGNPIVASTNMRFRLYTVSSGGASIYDTGTCSVSPDEDGIHNVLIGQDCGAGIPSSTFTENTEIWLGATVGSDAEMTPRQQIANVPYALNAETLQGLPPGSSASNIPIINSAGDMLIAATGPQIASTFASETFVVSSAQAVTLQSAGSGDVTLTATESGTIKFATGGSQHGVITNGGLFGFGTTGPDAKLDVLYTGGEQLRLTYTDGSVYTGLTTNSSGDLTIATTGGDYAFTDTSNTLFQIKDKGVYPFINLAGKTDTGDPASCAEGDIYYNDTDDTIKICHESNTWEALDGATATVWTDSGTTAYLTDTTDEVVIGGSSPLSSAKLSIDGDADQIQMIVQGNATQTSGLAVFEQSDGTDVLTLSNSGDLVWTGNTTIGNASGDTVTSNAATWTFANDTTVALSGGVNGINFDSNTLSIDGTNDRIGVGTAAPDGKFQVSGASIGKALAIFNETGDQDIIVASASGATRFRVATDGTIYGGYFLDISNTAYGIDPASTSNFGGYSMKITGGALLAADSGNVGIGDQTPDAKLNIQATTEQLRLDYDDSNYTSFTVGSGGDLTIAPTGGDTNVTGNLAISGGTTLGDASGDTVTANAAAWTFANDTTVALSGGVNGINFDSNTLSIDSTNDRIGIGTAAPGSKLSVFASTTTAQTLLNLTNDVWTGSPSNEYVNMQMSLTYSDALIRTGVQSHGDNSSYIAFLPSTGGSGTPSEVLRIEGDNQTVGIGTTGPDAKLDVLSTTEQLRLTYTDGSAYTGFTVASTGDITFDSSGGDFNLANADVLNIGGSGTDVAYNAIGDSLAGAANVASDNDLYIEDDLEVDGTIFGSLEGTVDLNFTDGSVLFANSSGVISQDNTNFFWNDSTNRLGLGDTTPDVFLDVTGTTEQLRLSYETGDTNYASFTLSSGGDLTIAPTGSDTNITGNLATSGGTTLGDASGDTVTANAAAWTFANDTTVALTGGTDGLNFDTNTLSIDGTNDRIGVGTAAPAAKIHALATTEQLRLGYDGSNYSSFTISSGGDLTIAPTGSDTNVTGNLAVSGNTSLGDASTDTVTVTGKEIINFDTASADQNGLYINTSQNTATAGTLRGLNVGANFWATSGTQTGVNGLDFTVQATGNGGTVTTMKGISAWGTVSTGATVGTFKLVDAANPSNSGTITSLSGYSIDNLTSGTNNTLILAGTSTIPSGNWGIYNTSSYSNYLAGTTGIGTAGPDAKLDVLSTTEQLRLTYTDGSAYSAFTVSSGGDLTLDPTGGDIVADANVNPNTHDTYDLGTDGARWRDLYLGPDTLHVGTSTSDEGTLKYVTSTNVLTMTNNFGDTDFGSTSDGFNFTLGGGAGDDFLVDATTLAVESDNHRVGIGTAAPDAAWLDIAAATTAKAQINLTTSAGTDVSAPGSGDLWWNGTNLYFYNGSINKDLLAAGGSGPWTDGGSYVYTTAGEVINLGGITGTAYHAISDSGTTSHSLASDDDLFVEGDFEVDTAFFTDGSTTIGDASGDTVTANAAAWTFANDTTVALTGGLNGLNIDSDTFSVDGANDRIGVGTAAPSAKIHALATTEQLRLGYDVSNYASFTTSSGGDMTVDVTGGQLLLADADTINIGGVSALAYNAISDSGGATSHSLASDDDLFVEGDTEVNGTLFADGETVLTTVSGAGLSDCDSATSILLWDSSTKQFSCGKDNNINTLGTWTKLNVTASLTNSQLDRPIQTHLPGAVSEMYMPYAGNVVGISVAGSAARAAGSATFTVFKNDSTTGFTCVIDGTNTQYNKCTQASGSDTFSAGDYLDVRVTTDLGWSPATNEYGVEIWVEMDTGADVAELYNVKDGTIRSADIVSIDPTLTDGVMKSTGKYDTTVLGVIATKPGVLLGQNDVPDIGASRAVALTGRVPVKVTSENGPIHAGDSIAASSLPGVGMKSTQAARVVGRALGEWTNPDPHAVGTVMMFVEPGYDAGYILTHVQDLLKVAQNVIVSDTLHAKNVLTENISAMSATVVNFTTDVLTADSATISDAQIKKLNAEALKAQKIETETLQAKKITTDALESGDIHAGTIIADEIDTKNVRELKERLEDLAQTRSSSKIDAEELHRQVSDIQEYITKLTDEETPTSLADTQTYQIASPDTTIDPGTTTTSLGETVTSADLESLTVTGTAQISQLVVADAFSAGDVFIKGDSLLSMSNDLKLSALASVDIMNGGVVITADGTLTAKGEIIAQKGIRTDTIRPQQNSKDVSVILDTDQNSSASNSGEFSIQNEGGTRVASINANGTARFNNLSLNTYHEATNSAVVISAKDTYRQNGIYAPSIKTHGASSGNGIMPSGENDIIIFTDTITPKSIVNLTATSSTQNKSLFVDLVEPCTSTDNQLCQPYFRVALDDEVDTDVTFNWLIVN